MKNVFKNKYFALFLVFTALLSGCAEWRSKKTLGENIDDANIVATVKAKLIAEPKIPSKNISINSYKGTVQLSGFVDNEAQINQAVAIARNVNGVNSVVNNLMVSPNP
ncbi:MAG: transport-associated protein [Francisellaceae bacterium]|nr:transport-associated protein [Francisellaceae bacterium]